MVTLVPNYLNNSTSVGREANNTITLYVRDIFQSIVLTLFNPHNNPGKTKLKVPKGGNRDLDQKGDQELQQDRSNRIGWKHQ